ncbi:MAG TPA: thiamine phosphate synthase [Nevskiaceae bacterium]|nr:thiamine phosphate synthase [Nevskiaceae bacterium]
MKRLRGLYAITSQRLCADDILLLRSAEAALRGGAALLQYRDKWSDAAARQRRARALRELCVDHGALFIVNDEVELALHSGAQGIHLGATDATLQQARERLPPGSLVGISCSNSAARIEAAAAAGADYVAIGRFHPSSTKPDAPPATLDHLRDMRARYPDLPICAIGGITPEHSGPLVAAGADMIAAVDGLFGGDDAESAARRYCAAMGSHTRVTAFH